MHIEDHLIIRLPEDWIIQMTDGASLDITPLTYPSESPNRVFGVSLKSQSSIAFLLDLPCIIESHKTVDYINFFKVSDIAQMLYVLPESEKDDPRNKDSSLNHMLIPDERYKARSGITPGTHDITSRFFKRESHESPEEVTRVESFIKSVMENGSAVLVDEELIELAEGEKTPSDVEEFLDALDLEEDIEDYEEAIH